MLKFLRRGATFIQGGTSIPESRVERLEWVGAQFNIQLVYTSTLSFTLRIQSMSGSLPISNSYFYYKAKKYIFLNATISFNKF